MIDETAAGNHFGLAPTPRKDVIMDTAPHLLASQHIPGKARRPVTGGYLIASSVLAVIGFVVLGSAFGWPDVLDEPGTSALDKYIAAQGTIQSGFYAMTLSSLVLIPAAFGLQAAFAKDGAAARAVTAIGVLGAFAQMLGWLRWVIAVPVQADLWTAAGTDPQKRYTVGTAYDTLNAYAGGTLGEHLGWLLQGIWAIGIAVLALRAKGLPRWLSGTGVVLAVAWTPLVAVGTAAHIPTAETLGVSVFYSLWYIWLLLLGGYITLRPISPATSRTQALTV